MKNWLFFCLFILLTGYAYAGQNTLATNYPATKASYTNIMLIHQANLDVLSCSAVNNEAVFVDPATGNLEMCINQNLVVPTTNKGCFNRFCFTAGPDGDLPPPNCAVSCPMGYTQAQSNGVPINDKFVTNVLSGPPFYWVNSIVCCQTGIYNAPT